MQRSVVQIPISVWDPSEHVLGPVQYASEDGLKQEIPVLPSQQSEPTIAQFCVPQQ